MSTEEEPVGSLAEEAAKLFAAVQGRVRDVSPEVLDHLAKAGSELLQAAQAIFAAVQTNRDDSSEH